jgi:hypothetical protein
MSMNVRKLRCWWLGCAQHPQDSAPPEHAHCEHCGEWMDYESHAGIAGFKWKLTTAASIVFRMVWPSRCSDCGKRYGGHEQCVPF